MIALIKPFLPLIFKVGFAVLLSGGLIAWFQVTRAENRALKAEVASYEQAYITNRKTIVALEQDAAKRAREIRRYIDEKNLYRKKVEHVNRKLSAVLQRDGVSPWSDTDMPIDVINSLREIEGNHDVGGDPLNGTGRTYHADAGASKAGEYQRRLGESLRKFAASYP